MPNLLQKVLAYTFVGLIVSIGPILFAIALVNGAQRLLFLHAAASTTGQVVALRQAHTKSSTRPSYYPSFRFTAPNGESITVASNIAGKYMPWLGKSVPVLYLPANPHEAHIDTFGQLWESTLVPGIVGAAFSTIPLLIYLRRRRANS